VIRNPYKTTRPQTVKYAVGNLSLFPASLLPFRDEWQHLAAELPTGEVLLIVPAGPSKLRNVLQALSPALRARGRHVTTLPTRSLS